MKQIEILSDRMKAIGVLKDKLQDDVFEYAKSKFKHGQVIAESGAEGKRVVFLQHRRNASIRTTNGDDARVCVLTYPLTKSGKPGKIGITWADVDKSMEVTDKEGKPVFVNFE